MVLGVVYYSFLEIKSVTKNRHLNFHLPHWAEFYLFSGLSSVVGEILWSSILLLVLLADHFPTFYSARTGREIGSSESLYNVSCQLPKILGDPYFCVLLMDRCAFVGAEIKCAYSRPLFSSWAADAGSMDFKAAAADTGSTHFKMVHVLAGEYGY